MKLFMVLLSVLMLTLAVAGRAEASVGPGSDTPVQSTQDGSQATAAEQQPGAPLPGTLEEVRNYEQRQQQSPEVQGFAGGSLGVIAVVLLVIIIFILVD